MDWMRTRGPHTHSGSLRLTSTYIQKPAMVWHNGGKKRKKKIDTHAAVHTSTHLIKIQKKKTSRGDGDDDDGDATDGYDTTQLWSGKKKQHWKPTVRILLLRRTEKWTRRTRATSEKNKEKKKNTKWNKKAQRKSISRTSANSTINEQQQYNEQRRRRRWYDGTTIECGNNTLQHRKYFIKMGKIFFSYHRTEPEIVYYLDMHTWNVLVMYNL